MFFHPETNQRGREDRVIRLSLEPSERMVWQVKDRLARDVYGLKEAELPKLLAAAINDAYDRLLLPRAQGAVKCVVLA